MIEQQRSPNQLDQIIGKATERKSLEHQDLLYLLSLDDEASMEKLFSAARAQRSRFFADQIFLYGFVYFSTYCRNDCAFCFYRRSNPVSERYRKSPDEVVETAVKLAESGVHLIDLTMGEDPHYFQDSHFTELLDLAAAVKKATNLPLMISPGVLPAEILAAFSEIDVDWYACYQETHNRDLYNRLRLNQDYDQRFAVKAQAHQLGMLIEEGLLVGIGEEPADLVTSFQAMAVLSADQVRVMSFIPQKGTPLEKTVAKSRQREMLVIAVMRLLFPEELIPASLDVDGIAGLKARLNAGANVVTSIIPPHSGMLGVSQSTLDIREGGRTVEGIRPILKECGLQPATAASYQDWVRRRRAVYQQG